MAKALAELKFRRLGKNFYDWLVGSFFYDAFSELDHYSVDDRVMMKWKEYGRKPSWPDFKVQSCHSPGGTE
jgi:hypothetical protein